MQRSLQAGPSVQQVKNKPAERRAERCSFRLLVNLSVSNRDDTTTTTTAVGYARRIILVL